MGNSNSNKRDTTRRPENNQLCRSFKPTKEPFNRPTSDPIANQTNSLISYPIKDQPLQDPPAANKEDRIVENGQRSWNTWVSEYTNHMSRGPYKFFYDRISSNTDKFEQDISGVRMRRLTATTNHYTRGDPVKLLPSINSYIPIEIRLQSYRRNDDKHFSLQPKLPELTHEMLFCINEASRPNPPDEVLAELEGLQILRKDIQRLLGTNWLNDEIINVYMNLLVLRGKTSPYKRTYAFNTFFYPKLRESGYSSIRRWTRRIDIFSYDFLIVPVHLGSHWCLAFIDFPNREISYYDSLGGPSNGCCVTLLDYLRDESNDKKKQDFDDENWRLVEKFDEGIPVQLNYSDCGVFACIYAEYLTRQAKLTFSQENIPYFRKKMIYEIITKKILE